MKSLRARESPSPRSNHDLLPLSLSCFFHALQFQLDLNMSSTCKSISQYPLFAEALSKPPVLHTAQLITVDVRNESFPLPFEQLQSDQPSLFTILIADPSSNTSLALSSTHLQFPRDPSLFPLIANHLSGYQILPLNAFHFATSEHTTLVNLLADAEYYQLPKLQAVLKKELAKKGAAGLAEGAEAAEGKKGKIQQALDTIKGHLGGVGVPGGH